MIRHADVTDSFAVASSYGCSLAGKRISKNLKHLKEVTVNSFFLDNSMRFASNEELSFPQLQLYRLILTHLALDESARVPHCFEYSQKAVYGKSVTLGITCMLLISRISSRPPPRFPTVHGRAAQEPAESQQFASHRMAHLPHLRSCF